MQALADLEQKILEDDSLTFSEKLLSLKRVDEPGKPASAGDLIVGKIDFTMATDGTAPLSISVFREMGAKKVWDSSKIIFVLDHTYPPANEQVAGLHKMMRDFSKEQNIRLFEASICHQLILEQYSVPGMLFLGADSHSTTNGCVGAFSSGVGSTDASAIWASGRSWLKVPESIKINLRGRLNKGVYAKDIALKVLGILTTEGATYRCVEYGGPTIPTLGISSRATLCNMCTETGAKAAIVEPDDVTHNYMQSVGRIPMAEVHAGKNAQYSRTVEVSVDELEPVVSAPNSPDNVKHIREVEGTLIDQAFLGSCTNARLDDLEVGASTIKGRRVKDGVRLIVTPASSAVFHEALNKGILNVFMEAGGVVTNSTCGACPGTHCGVLASGEVCISSSNRNFIGRMGARDSKVYLASPAIVIASAIKGVISDPREFL